MRSHFPTMFVALVGAVAASVFSVAPVCADEASLSRDVRRILSDRCFQCHGPDNAARQAGLRLDQRTSALMTLESGERAVVPHDVETSALIQRIKEEDESIRMPPADSGKQLTPQEIDLLTRWVEQGAEWEEHWAFRPLQLVEPSRVDRESWIRNPIDRFVIQRLEVEGLSPSQPAAREQLLRRVTLDLTGLPPTLRELDDFLSDSSAEAYEKVVDRLLTSPAYGERMALEWLDAARYADTHGYLMDSERQMWRWRDWVIDAFNRNMPFDQFTIEQLAGDLLPEASDAQKLASGFNRNHVINGEFGAIGEEYVVEYICDRVNTVGTIWMGLTLECARCHDHKFDPISQREFYGLYAFFDNIGENGVDGFLSNAAPVMRAPTPDQSQRLSELDADLKHAEAVLNRLNPEIDAAQTAWEPTFRQPTEDVLDSLIHYWKLDRDLRDAAGSDVVGNPNDFAMPPFGSGVFGNSVVSIGFGPVRFPGAGRLDREDTFTLSAWALVQNPHGRRSLFTRMRDGTTFGPGYAFQLHDGRLSLVLAHEYPGNCLEVESEGTIAADVWQHAAATYDGSGSASGIRLYINGEPQKLHVLHDSLNGSFDIDELLMLMDGTPNAVIKGQLDEPRIYGRVLSESEVRRIAGVSIHSLLAVPKDERTPEQQRRIRECFLAQADRKEWTSAYETAVALRPEKAAFEESIPSVMVMQETEKPKEARMLVGGAYDRPGDVIEPGTPDVLPPLDDALSRDRLGLAQWLVSGENPLTARVTVNRYWQMYFGTGLVKTAGDFGSQGEPPSHPELLDWLAAEFIRSGWDIKALQRLIVTSATYRQSSLGAADSSDHDPENRLMSRGPRFRLQAEWIRDQALAQSGLLTHECGGPSVKPYQPPGLWKEGAWDPTGNKWSAQVYRQGDGTDLYRRSLYTFWKRTSPPPSMLLFDASERQRCSVTRTRTNTPLQALVLMNDPQFVEAGRKLAERIMKEGGESREERLAFGFRLMTCRQPSASELLPLLAMFDKQYSRFREQPRAAREFLSAGESSCDETLDACQLAAYATVGSVLLNLDETITKN